MAKDISQKLQTYQREAEEREAKKKASELKMPYFNLYITPCDPDALKLISEEDSHEAEIVPFELKFKELFLATIDPKNGKAREIIKHLEDDGYDIKIFIVSYGSLKKAQENYKWLARPRQEITGATYVSRKIIEQYEKYPNAFEKLASDLKNFKEIDISAMLEIILAASMSADASDIHIEPQEHSIDLRLRVDGILQNAGNIEKPRYKSLLMRLKLLAKLKLNIHNTPQDGHFTIKVKEEEKIGNEIEIRVSIMPNPYGESIVLRILDPSKTIINLEKLGLRKDILDIINEEVEKPQGFVVNTGPTGSGKTTTLYAMLQKINSPDIKIVTIEDPVEYRLEGIDQSQIDASAGYTFASGLKSILRHDPDVILVGEIRDRESAEIAVQSAMTGHLVLSTIHANDAISAIPRFLELNINPSILAASLNLIIAQRLVRKLCSCAEYEPPSSVLRKEIESILNSLPIKVKRPDLDKVKIGKPKGCFICNQTGYKGRTAVMEAYKIYPDVKKLILENGRPEEFLKVGLDHDFTAMQQDALLKILDGVTSFEEVESVVGKVLEVAGKEKISPRIFDEYRQKIVSIQDLQKEIKLLPEEKINDLAEIIFAASIITDASDIHIEPQEDGSARARLRIDGILYETAILQHDFYESFLARIKYLSDLKIYIHDSPQDGHFTIEAAGENMEVRVSTMPGLYGETIVLRILNPEKLVTKLEDLGLRPDNLEIISEEIKKPQGFILNTGPTGSGKTTTLYAVLQKINLPGVKIITIEDPIEYRISGISQSQINPNAGYDFSSGLKSIMRQNPDIVLVGEIRDVESAGIALQAAMTGHLVFSTIHANDSAGAVPRLLELKINPNIVISALNLVIAQRLMRRACLKCSENIKIPEEMSAKIERELKKIPPTTLAANKIYLEKIYEIKIKKVKEKGCAFCNFTGYKGRVAIFELLRFTRNIQTIINEKVSDLQLKVAAEKEGFTNMQQDALIKVIQGITDIEEAERVLGKIL